MQRFFYLKLVVDLIENSAQRKGDARGLERERQNQKDEIAFRDNDIHTNIQITPNIFSRQEKLSTKIKKPGIPMGNPTSISIVFKRQG
jgi:hypothetical protein